MRFLLMLAALLSAAGCSSGCAHHPTPPPTDQDWLITECGGVWWSRVPVTLTVDPSAEQWRDLVVTAVDWWGPQLLRLVPNDAPTDTIIVAHPDMIGGAVTNLSVDMLTCEAANAVVVLPVVPDEWAARMVAHELGHVLGLDHDPDMPESVMYPTTAPGTYFATLADRERLRIRYQGHITTCEPLADD